MKSRCYLPTKIFPRKGFTLIELLAVMAIFAFLTVAVVSIYPSSTVRLKVSSIASNLQATIREAQINASAVSSQGQTVAGYGIDFPLNATSTYQTFVDKVTSTMVNGIYVGNQKYDGSNEDYALPKNLIDGYAISDICVSSQSNERPFSQCRTAGVVGELTVLYKRPSAQPSIYINDSTTTQFASACIQIELEKVKKGDAFIRNVILTSTGLIGVTNGGCQSASSRSSNSGSPVGLVVTNIDASSIGNNVIDVAADTFNNAYVALASNKKIVKIDGAGAISDYGTMLITPVAMSVDTTGTLYVLETNGVPSITKFIAGSPPTMSSLTVPASVTPWPSGITTDPSGFIYVTDSSLNKVWKIDPISGVATDFGTTDTNPHAITADSSGNIYTANQATVTKLNSSGTFVWTRAVGINPISVAVDASGNVYTANAGDNTVTKITSIGVATVAFATVGANPKDIAVDSLGNIYTANSGALTISKITPSGTVSTLTSTGNGPNSISIFNTVVYVGNQTSDSVTKVVQ